MHRAGDRRAARRRDWLRSGAGGGQRIFVWPSATPSMGCQRGSAASLLAVAMSAVVVAELRLRAFLEKRAQKVSHEAKS
jgi:hypothetical protein